MDKLELTLRIVIITILLTLGSIIMINKYGTPSSLEDNALLDSTGTKIADCREALIYYAENKLNTINQSKAEQLYREFNLTNISIR